MRRLAPGAWCWFADPRALHHAGRFRRTYVGWIDREGSIQVFSHDHDSREEVVTRLHRRLEVDNARTMIRVPDERPYLKVVSDGDAAIHFAFTDGHPRNVLTGIYHAVYRDGRLRRSDGSPIRALGSGPITPAQATRVYDPNASGVRAWIHDIALDASGAPLIVFAALHSPDDHRYVYARWSATGWVRHPIVNAGGTIAGDGAEVHYSGGITFDHDDPRRVLLSREIGGVHEVERWETDDGGASWQHAAVTTGSSRPNVRPIAARDRTDEAFDVLWMRGRYTNYRDYGTSIMTTDQLSTPDP